MPPRGLANGITAVDSSCRNHMRQPMLRSDAANLGLPQRRPTLVSLDEVIRADPQSALYSFLLRPPGDEHLTLPYGVIDFEEGWIRKLYDKLKERWARMELPEELPTELTDDPATWHLRTLRKRTFKTEDPRPEAPVRRETVQLFDLLFGPQIQSYCRRVRDSILQEPLTAAILDGIRRLMSVRSRSTSQPNLVGGSNRPPSQANMGRMSDRPRQTSGGGH